MISDYTIIIRAAKITVVKLQFPNKKTIVIYGGMVFNATFNNISVISWQSV